MEFLKKSIHMDQIGCEEQTQITLEDDVNIADAKPDVYQVVTQQGHVELEEVRASDGHVHVKGVLHFKVLYLADEETHHPACMEGELAFEEQILMGSVSGTDQVQAQAILEDLSVGMINSRKLSVQALLQIRLFTERMKQLDVAVGLDGTEQIEVKKKDLQALDLIVAKKDILRVKKDILLPGGMPNIFALLWKSCQIREMAFRVLDGKLQATGELSLFFFYEEESETKKAVWYETTVPVSAAIECQGVREGMLEQIGCSIGHLEIEAKADEDGEERVILLDLVLDLDIRIYEETNLSMIEDLYGIAKQADVVRGKGQYRRLLVKNTAKTRVSDQFSISPGMPQIQQICGSFGEVFVQEIKKQSDGVLVKGTVNVQILYESAEEEVPCGSEGLLLSLLYGWADETATLQESELYNDAREYHEAVFARLEQLSVQAQNEQEAEVRAVVCVKGLICADCEEEIVTDALLRAPDPEKQANQPGIVVYLAGEGETLWDICKKYDVPMDGMREMNNLTQDEIHPGDQLLIVKGYAVDKEMQIV